MFPFPVLRVYVIKYKSESLSTYDTGYKKTNYDINILKWIPDKDWIKGIMIKEA